jgi:hypothetical protein
MVLRRYYKEKKKKEKEKRKKKERERERRRKGNFFLPLVVYKPMVLVNHWTMVLPWPGGFGKPLTHGFLKIYM